MKGYPERLTLSADLWFVVGIGYEVGAGFNPTNGQFQFDFKLRAGIGLYVGLDATPG